LKVRGDREDKLETRPKSARMYEMRERGGREKGGEGGRGRGELKGI
jgi:hypothetical protein